MKRFAIHGIRFPFVLLPALILFGCAGAWFPSDFAGPDNRIAFGHAGTEHAGVWGTGDLSLSYRYVLAEESAGFEGELTLQPRVGEFTTLHRLVFRVHFLDGEGRILESRVLLASPYRQWMPLAPLSFQRRLALPEGAVAFGFSYDGAAGEGGGSGEGSDLRSGGTDWEFWSLP